MQIDRDFLTKAYCSVLKEVPYNSVSSVFNVAREVPPAVFGGNCIWQVMQLRKRLLNEGVRGTYFLRDGRHHTLIVPSREALFLLDPYLMHKEPINLTEMLDSREKQRKFIAYPNVIDASGKVQKGYIAIVFEKDKHRFVIEKGRFNPNLSEYRVLRFFFDLNCPKYRTLSLSNPSVAFHPEQTSLSIRVLDIASGEVMHLIYPIHKFYNLPVNESHLYVKTNQCLVVPHSKSRDFNNSVSRIATTLNCTIEEMLRFMRRGVVLYNRLAPQDINFFSQNPTNM
jgi:hypothetical protein